MPQIYLNIGKAQVVWAYDAKTQEKTPDGLFGPVEAIKYMMAHLPSPFKESDFAHQTAGAGEIEKRDPDLADVYKKMIRREEMEDPNPNSPDTPAEKRVPLVRRLNSLLDRYNVNPDIARNIDADFASLQSSVASALKKNLPEFDAEGLRRCAEWALEIGLKTKKGAEGAELLKQVSSRLFELKHYDSLMSLVHNTYGTVVNILDNTFNTAPTIALEFAVMHQVIADNEQERIGLGRIIRSLLSKNYGLVAMDQIEKYLTEFKTHAGADDDVRMVATATLADKAKLKKLFDICVGIKENILNISIRGDAMLATIERIAVRINAESQGKVDADAKLVPLGMSGYANPKDKVRMGTMDLYYEIAVILRNKKTGQTELLVVDRSMSAEDVKLRMSQFSTRNKSQRMEDNEAIIIGSADKLTEGDLKPGGKAYHNLVKVIDGCALSNIRITQAQIFNEYQPTAFTFEVPKQPDAPLVLQKAVPGKRPEFIEAFPFIRLLSEDLRRTSQVSFIQSQEFYAYVISTEMQELWTDTQKFERAIYAKFLMDEMGWPAFTVASVLGSQQAYTLHVIGAKEAAIANAAGDLIYDLTKQQNVPVDPATFKELNSGKKKFKANVHPDGISEEKIRRALEQVAQVDYPYAIGKGSKGFNDDTIKIIGKSISWDFDKHDFVVDRERIARETNMDDGKIYKNRFENIDRGRKPDSAGS